MVKGAEEDRILKCPFCSKPIAEPTEIRTRFGNTFTGGRCECGAIYVYDRSGHNLGDAYVDGLTYACNGDADRAWSLTPDVDYEVVELSYDARRNRFSGPQRKAPTFLFIMIKNSTSKAS